MDTPVKKAVIALGGILAVAVTAGLTLKKTQSATAAAVAGASFADTAPRLSGQEATEARQEFVRDYTDFVNTIQATPDHGAITLDFLPPGTKSGFHWVFSRHTASLTLRQVSITGNTASTDIDLTTSYITDGSHGPALPSESRLTLRFSERDQWTKIGGRWILTKGEPIGQTHATLNEGPLPPDVPVPGAEGSVFFPFGTG
jgi:hypothetical protein